MKASYQNNVMDESDFFRNILVDTEIIVIIIQYHSSDNNL